MKKNLKKILGKIHENHEKGDLQALCGVKLYGPTCQPFHGTVCARHTTWLVDVHSAQAVARPRLLACRRDSLSRSQSCHLYGHAAPCRGSLPLNHLPLVLLNGHHVAYIQDSSLGYLKSLFTSLFPPFFRSSILEILGRGRGKSKKRKKIRRKKRCRNSLRLLRVFPFPFLKGKSNYDYNKRFFGTFFYIFNCIIFKHKFKY